MIAMLVVVSLPAAICAEPDGGASLEVAVHPSVPTMLHLPDRITRARLNDAGEMQVTYAARTLHIRPQPGAPLGRNALIEVRTTSLRLTIRLRVVEHAQDAQQELVVVVAEPERMAEDARVTPEAATPGAGDPSPARRAVRAQTSSARSRASAGPERSGFSLAAVMAWPGVTGLEIPGYESRIALQPHRGLGLRFASALPWAPWLVAEIQVGADWFIDPLDYRKQANGSRVEVSGLLLRMEAGARARLPAWMAWTPSLYAGIGMQTHLRRSRQPDVVGEPQVTTLPEGIVLALGMGLHYRARDVLMGVDFQMRRGGPDDYTSVAVFWTFGYFLGKGGMKRAD